MNELKENIIKLVGKNPEYLDEVLSHFSFLKLKRNEYILREGEVCRHIYYVKSGLIQVSKSDHHINEITTDLILPDDWFTDIHSFKNAVCSQLNGKATKATEVYIISYQSFGILMHMVPKFAEVYMTIIESKYHETTERIMAFNTLNATEKVNWLKRTHTRYFDLVPDKLIAEYLGISKETFCRLKQK